MRLSSGDLAHLTAVIDELQEWLGTNAPDADTAMRTDARLIYSGVLSIQINDVEVWIYGGDGGGEDDQLTGPGQIVNGPISETVTVKSRLGWYRDALRAEYAESILPFKIARRRKR